MSGERFDALDWASGRPAGFTIARARAHAEGIPHAALHLWLAAQRPSGWQLLFQRRGLHKETYPGLLDATVGGHLAAGESWQQALRETHEELGIQVDAARCTWVRRHRWELRTAAVWDREWLDEVAMRADRPLSAYRFPDGEASGVAEVPFALLRTLSLNPAATGELRCWDGVRESVLTVGLSAFNPHYFKADLLVELMDGFEAGRFEGS